MACFIVPARLEFLRHGAGALLWRLPTSPGNAVAVNAGVGATTIEERDFLLTAFVDSARRRLQQKEKGAKQ